MKILNKSDNVIIEVTDENRIEKLLGYPDKFEPIEEKLTADEKNFKKGKRL